MIPISIEMAFVMGFAGAFTLILNMIALVVIVQAALRTVNKKKAQLLTKEDLVPLNEAVNALAKELLHEAR